MEAVMRANIVAATLLLFGVGCTARQTTELTEQQKAQIGSEVKAVADSLGARWARMDAEGAMQCYAPDVTVEGDSAPRNFAQYRQSWIDFNNTAASVRVTDFREDYLILAKDLVIVTWVGKSESILRSGDTLTSDLESYTDVYQKVAGQWKVVYQTQWGTPVLHKAAAPRRPRR
jgi:ketosteroid isomerase-like protein